MCLPSFEDFISENYKYKKFSESKSARDVFDFLSEPSNIQLLIYENDRGKPALYGCLKSLEQNFCGRVDFDFNNGFVKQCVGTMAKFILRSFGYSSLEQKDMPKGSFKFFTSGTNYKFDEHQAFFRLVQKITVEKISKS